MQFSFLIPVCEIERMNTSKKDQIDIVKEKKRNAFDEMIEGLFSDNLFKRASLLSAIFWWWIQVISITLISPAYLRFFSISQMLSDAIMLIVVFYWFFYLPLKVLVFLTKKQYGDLTLKLWAFYTLIFIIIDPLFITKQYQYQINPSTLEDWLFSCFIILAVLVMIWFFIKEIYRIIPNKIIQMFMNGKFLTSEQLYTIFVFLPFIFIALFIVTNTFTQINKLLLLPSHFKNLEYICNDWDSYDCNIRYFNDKYIFIESEEKTEILEFSAFFQKNNN